MPDGPDVNSGINEKKKNGATLFDRKEIPVGMKCCIYVFTEKEQHCISPLLQIGKDGGKSPSMSSQ